jgi:hypothetical protein
VVDFEIREVSGDNMPGIFCLRAKERAVLFLNYPRDFYGRVVYKEPKRSIADTLRDWAMCVVNLPDTGLNFEFILTPDDFEAFAAELWNPYFKTPIGQYDNMAFFGIPLTVSKSCKKTHLACSIIEME